jgi:hypothetical protein
VQQNCETFVQELLSCHQRVIGKHNVESIFEEIAGPKV